MRHGFGWDGEVDDRAGEGQAAGVHGIGAATRSLTEIGGRKVED